MKYFKLLIVFALVVYGCNNDDDVTTPQCAEVTNLQASAISTTSVTISWENSNTSGYVVLEYGLGGFVPGNGTSTQVDSDDSLLLNSLSEATSYDVYVTAFCSATNEADRVGPLSFTTEGPDVIAQFLPTLSQINIFQGDLVNLVPNDKAFQYELVTELYTDYAKKQRIIALPIGTSLEYDGSGLPVFPVGTLIAKTFYYNLNEQDLSQGKKIIETRILINTSTGWELGNYLWNDAQTEATLDTGEHIVQVDWVNEAGDAMSVDYKVPDSFACLNCHSNSGEEIVIGPKLRTMNFEVDGLNQLQKFIDEGYLINAPDVSTILALANWEDTSETLENRARAYFDIQCAQCHTDGGFCEFQSTLRLSFETPFGDTQIFERRNQIIGRMQSYQEGFSMPLIGTTTVHSEGFDLIQEYINTL